MMKLLLCSLLVFPYVRHQVINMTNHVQHSLLIHALWGYAAYTARCCSYHWFGTHTHTHTQTHTPPLYVWHSDPCRTDLYYISEERHRVFHQQGRAWFEWFPLWPLRYDCILTPLSEVTQIFTNSWAEENNHSVAVLCCVDHKCRSLWLSAK